MEQATVIQARGISKHFGQVKAVQNLNLTIPQSVIYGFLGPNGSGKSTTIRMLCGLLTPTNGEISVLGYAIPEQAEALKRKVGYMTQRFSLYEDLSVQENLEFMGQIHGLAHTERSQRINAVKQLYQLEHLKKQRAGTLSGGQKQRLALATAVLHQPRLLFLDEPTSAVDPENRRAFWESLFDLVAEETTILVSTHYMDEAERCHALAILDQGQLVAEGAPGDLAKSIDADIYLLRSKQPRQLRKALEPLPWVHSMAQTGNTLRVLTQSSPIDRRDEFYKAAQASSLTLTHCEPGSANLEDVFVQATRDHTSGGKTE